MSKRELQNERLDRLGRKLLEAARVNNEEIEKIAAAPQLFDSVKARIRAEALSRRKTKRFSSEWASLSFLNPQRAIIAFAILIVSVTCATVIIFKKQDSRQLAEQMIKHEAQPQITKAENLLPPVEIEETKIPAVKNRVSAEQIAFKVEKARLPNRVPKPSQVKPQSRPKKQPQEVFYSLAVAGNWEADGEDLQIVRAEISRSELFALGVNLSIENESEKLKTDLLVGSDGRPRAIRFVK